jgi:hypothetical protein
LKIKPETIAKGVHWKVAYPIIEEAVKAVLTDHDGPGLNWKEMLEAVGLKGAPQPTKERFIQALKALRGHGLADWFDTVTKTSRYNKEVEIREFIYLPPSDELLIGKLEDRKDELQRELNRIQADLEEKERE